MSTYFSVKTLPFWLLHIACIAAFFVEFSWGYVALAIGMYYLRMFFVTGGYHRYFSHKTYQTSRWFQFVLAFMAETSSQKGALWWAAHHRFHHKHSDEDIDLHSPKRGFWYAHIGWILDSKNEETEYKLINDFARFPELMWLNKYWVVPPVLFAVTIFLLGGWSALVWGFVISTVLLWHGTFTINSLSHRWGNRRYETTDTSKNNFVLALVTLGEGWHNNHHHYQASTRNGFFWWEIDITYYILVVFSWIGLVKNLRAVPAHALNPSGKSAQAD